MSESTIITASWRNVELGRIVLFTAGPFENKLAAIVQIIDHKRVLLDNPTETSKVPRHPARLADISLTPLVLPKIPIGMGSGALKKVWEAEKINDKWESSSWAKSRAHSQKRRNLTDFERFQVLRARKAHRFEVRKSMAKIVKAA